MTSKGKIIAVFILLISFFVPVSIFSQMGITNGIMHSDTSGIGQTYSGVIRISNAGLKNERVKLYQTDYLFYADGTNHFGNPGTTPRSNADWLRLEETEIVIAPGQEYEVNYTVTVPADGDLIGTYWSLVMVQSITKSLLNPDAPAEDSLGIKSGVRFAIQVVTNIGSTGTGNLSFSGIKLLEEEDLYTLQLIIENIGERRLSPFTYVDFYDENGVYKGRFNSKKRGVYPGTSLLVGLSLPGLEKGRYKAQLVADCGGDDLFGAVYSFNLK